MRCAIYVECYSSEWVGCFALTGYLRRNRSIVRRVVIVCESCCALGRLSVVCTCSNIQYATYCILYYTDIPSNTERVHAKPGPSIWIAMIVPSSVHKYYFCTLTWQSGKRVRAYGLYVPAGRSTISSAHRRRRRRRCRRRDHGCMALWQSRRAITQAGRRQ